MAKRNALIWTELWQLLYVFFVPLLTYYMYFTSSSCFGPCALLLLTLNLEEENI
ncbi:hypothetical protein Hanom_Chr16g01436491 [Helianthus anomalus]